MKALGLGIIGFIAALCCLTIVSPGYLWIGAAFALAIYLLFFAERTAAIALFVGLTIGLEFLGTQRFGMVILTSVLLYGITQLFSERLRFTSVYPRFIVAMLLGLILLNGTLFPLRGYATRALGLAIVALLATAGSTALQRFSQRSSYELL